MSPKPTIFLPSIDEINLHEAGTHLCLLENFFPDVIKVYWKEKNGNRVLESQQGNIIKTNDTYMKFSWLTVTKRSMDNEHVCIVKHENNKGGIDQEILFPSINKAKKQKGSKYAKEVTTHACVKKGSDSLQLQLMNTCAYYTYLLLLLKSSVYFVIVAFCVCRRTAVCGHGKSS
ncbi:T-cell receptor gamma alternate reading frame protein isoform X2 [Physeter macrocephalus]|uniref:T-cell receptor gamma alternate reading frame protein isoform X2 n=1 Tax=Physeter macrocephalus TaxID=9755 RepID=UPI0024325A72|nr:TCR gamma alternate reading frame protein isoform X2 [Physeter catodon]